MSCWENSARLPGLKEENSERPKGRPNHWAAYLFRWAERKL
jgi:hypothetical protein